MNEGPWFTLSSWGRDFDCIVLELFISNSLKLLVILGEKEYNDVWRYCFAPFYLSDFRCAEGHMGSARKTLKRCCMLNGATE